MMSFLTIAKKRFFTPPQVGLFLPRLFSSPTTPNPDLKTAPFMVNEYLVSTFGVAPATAARISKPITYLKSPQNPEAVRSFLLAQGFSSTEIKTIVTYRPTILCSSPQNTLAPNLRALREMNLSADALNQIILSEPEALRLRSAVHKINFWKDFVGGHEPDLVRVFKRNRGIIYHDINGGIATKLSFLESYGISIADIQRIIWTVSSFITSRVSKMEDMLNRAKEFGFHPKSGMLVRGLVAVASTTIESLHKKLELLKSFGWSEEQVLSAVQKSPTMFCLSEENWRSKMDFLREEVGLDNSYISSRPGLLTYCLEQRLKPRHNVLRLLQSKGLPRKRINYYISVAISSSHFVAKYINPHMDEIPELHEVYLAACASVAK